MMLALVLGLIAAAVAATVVAPLLRPGRAARDARLADRAVYRDQLREVERDTARGLLTAEEAASARREIERRLLATEGADRAPGKPFGGTAVAAALALAIAGVAAALYVALGAPGVPDQPYAGRAAERMHAAGAGDRADAERKIAALEARLRSAPEDAEGWLLLARSAAALDRWQQSAAAYRKRLALGGPRADIEAELGETLVMAADGIVTPEAQETFTKSVALDPGNAVARYYLALADAQAGKAQPAIDAWQQLAAEMPTDSPLRTQLENRIAEAATRAGLPVPPLAAAAPEAPDARAAMIRGMVEKLAGELQSRPDDLEGWLKLGRSYAVLQEKEKAAAAYEHAATLKPDDADIPLAEAEALLEGWKPGLPLPDRAVAALHRAESLRPEAPTVLWYLGLVAVQDRHFDAAVGYWKRLLAQLPSDSDEHRMVAAAIESLKGK
jgi:cytochrome c-type biogenesis protein CcmH